MRRLVVLAVLVAACSSGTGELPPLPRDPAAAVDGVLVVPSILDGPAVVDADRTDDPLAVMPPDLPDQVVVVDGDRGRAFVQVRTSGNDLAGLAYAENRFRIGGRDASYHRATGCRPELLVDDDGLVVISGDGWSRSDLVELARVVHVRAGRLVVDHGAGWVVAGRLPPGWQRSAAGSRVVSGGTQAYSQRTVAALPLGGASRAVLDALLCRRLDSLRTGISGMTIVPQGEWERREVRVAGRRVIIGKLADDGAYLAIAGGPTPRAIVVWSYEDLLAPTAAARLAIEAEVRPAASFAAQRAAAVDRQIERARASVAGLLTLAGKRVYAQGRDDDLAWVVTSVFRDGVGRLDAAVACLTIVRTAFGDVPASAGDGDCIEPSPKPDPVRVAASSSVSGYVWGVTDASIAEVEVTVDGSTHRVPTVRVDVAGLDRVFVAAVRPIATEPLGTSRAVVAEPVRVRGLRVDGSEATSFLWGTPECPALPSTAC